MRHHGIAALLLFTFLVPVCRADDEDAPPVVYPSVPAQAQTKAGLVPKGWIIETESAGDLNGDGVPDLMLVLHMTDPRNVVKNEGLGPDELDTNPRMLVVAFTDKVTKKYSVVVSNRTLIPRHVIPTMDDPLSGAEIVNKTVRVSLGLWMSAGSWYTSKRTLVFRYQDGCFSLIGYDEYVAKRNTGETTSVSINYLTKKAKTSTGNFENDREKVSWKPVKVSKLLCLDAVGDGLEFSPE